MGDLHLDRGAYAPETKSFAKPERPIAGVKGLFWVSTLQVLRPMDRLWEIPHCLECGRQAIATNLGIVGFTIAVEQLCPEHGYQTIAFREAPSTSTTNELAGLWVEQRDQQTRSERHPKRRPVPQVQLSSTSPTQVGGEQTC